MVFATVILCGKNKKKLAMRDEHLDRDEMLRTRSARNYRNMLLQYSAETLIPSIYAWTPKSSRGAASPAWQTAVS